MILEKFNEAMNILSRILRVFLPLLLLLSLSAPGSAQDQKKFSYAIFLDNSGSMRSQFDQVTAIGEAVVRQIHERGPVSIYDFTSQGRLQEARAVVTPRLEGSQDERLLEQTIANLYVVGGQTTLLDAIQVIAEGFGPPANEGVASERVIILITDGEDRKSQIREATLIQKLKDSKTRVYAIGMVQQLSSASKASDLLKNLTKETRGRVVFTKSSHDDLQRLLSDLALPVQ
jgi:Mg-chelatase subunit ChlD